MLPGHRSWCVVARRCVFFETCVSETTRGWLSLARWARCPWLVRRCVLPFSCCCCSLSSFFFSFVLGFLLGTCSLSSTRRAAAITLILAPIGFYGAYYDNAFLLALYLCLAVCVERSTTCSALAAHRVVLYCCWWHHFILLFRVVYVHCSSSLLLSVGQSRQTQQPGASRLVQHAGWLCVVQCGRALCLALRWSDACAAVCAGYQRPCL